jgi:DNA-binding response OmpR family regulator
MKALIVDDDDGIIQLVSLCLALIWPDIKIIWTHLGGEGSELVKSAAPDLVVLDLGLPDMSGYDVLKTIRSFSKVPLIVLTVRNEEVEVVRAFELGADDYIVKPFRQFEFLARVRSALARFIPGQGAGEDLKVTFGVFHFDPSLKRLEYRNKVIDLTSTESVTLRCLLENAGKVVGHKTLAQQIWGHPVPDAVKIIRVYIRHLREKIETDPNNPALIITKPGEGYLFTKTA